MSIRTVPKPVLTPPASSRPQTKRWTVPEFHRLAESGWFGGKNTILLDGEIIEMPIQNPPHSMGLNLADYLLKSKFGDGFVVRVQQPLLLSLWTDPEPDVAVVAGSVRDFSTHPKTAVLIVEISDSTLAIDIGEKMQLYAAGGIADYWVVDLNNRRLIVHRDPVVDASRTHGFRFADVRMLDPTASIAPLALPRESMRIVDLLP